MTTTTPEHHNDKPLGDGGSGASGGGSGGNLPGTPATGGDPRQGTRTPDASRPTSAKAEPGEPDERDLSRQPGQTAEVPLGSGDRPEPSGKGGFGSHSTEPTQSKESKPGYQDLPQDLPATVDKDDKPADK
jgi:hypothetical protein